MTEISVRAAGGAKALPLPGRNIKEVKNMTVKEAVILAAEELGVGDKAKNYYENGGEERERRKRS